MADALSKTYNFALVCVKLFLVLGLQFFCFVFLERLQRMQIITSFFFFFSSHIGLKLSVKHFKKSTSKSFYLVVVQLVILDI